MDSIVGEVWRPAAGFEGCYEVSNMGRIRSVDRKLKLSNGQVRRYKGRIRAPRITRHGYHHYGLYIGLVRRQKSAHRLVLETFVGPCPEGMEACHNDGNPGNNRLNNLRWDTDKANQSDRFKHGTQYNGEKHYCTRLTEKDVVEIRTAWSGGEKQVSIARRYGITFQAVHDIVKRRNWKHVA